MGCGGFKQNNILNISPTWVLHDGSIITFYGSGGFPLFWVDINGKNKPNKWGYDVFALMIMTDNSGNKLYLRQGGCMFYEKGGKSGTQMLQ